MMMMRYGSFCVVVVSLAAVSAFLAVPAHGSGDLCARSSHAVLCREVVRGAREPMAALKTALKVLKDETDEGKRKLAKVGRSEEVDVCTDLYDTSLNDLENSMSSISSHDISSAKNFLSSAMSNYVTCDDAFTEAGKKGPGDKRLSQIASILLYLATLTH